MNGRNSRCAPSLVERDEKRREAGLIAIRRLQLEDPMLVSRLRQLVDLMIITRMPFAEFRRQLMALVRAEGITSNHNRSSEAL